MMAGFLMKMLIPLSCFCFLSLDLFSLSELDMSSRQLACRCLPWHVVRAPNPHYHTHFQTYPVQQLQFKLFPCTLSHFDNRISWLTWLSTLKKTLKVCRRHIPESLKGMLQNLTSEVKLAVHLLYTCWRLELEVTPRFQNGLCSATKQICAGLCKLIKGDARICF